MECHTGTRASVGQFRVHAWTKRLRGLALDIIMRYDIIINTYSIRCRTVITRLIKLFSLSRANCALFLDKSKSNETCCGGNDPDLSNLFKPILVVFLYLFFFALITDYHPLLSPLYRTQCSLNYIRTGGTSNENPRTTYIPLMKLEALISKRFTRPTNSFIPFSVERDGGRDEGLFLGISNQKFHRTLSTIRRYKSTRVGFPSEFRFFGP